ncbi:MAG: carboxypeptidase-like regulatory domain-containing protein [Leptothrix sp. (in: b-proteobacteria)]
MGAVAVAWLVSACGGGGGSNGSSNASTNASFTATVTDAATQQVVAGAIVTLAYTDNNGNATSVITTTDANGKYTISAPASSLTSTSQVLVTIAANNFQGAAQVVSASNIVGGATQAANIQLAALQTGQLSPAIGIGPIHVGNNSNDGSSINSKFQIPAKAAVWSGDLGNLNGYSVTGKSMVISMNMHGLEMPIYDKYNKQTGGCSDTASLYQLASDGVTPAVTADLTSQLTSSLADGSYGVVRLTVDPTLSALFDTTKDIYLKITAGPCTDGTFTAGGAPTVTDNADDFEFANLLLTVQ